MSLRKSLNSKSRQFSFILNTLRQYLDCMSGLQWAEICMRFKLYAHKSAWATSCSWLSAKTRASNALKSILHWRMLSLDSQRSWYTTTYLLHCGLKRTQTITSCVTCGTNLIRQSQIRRYSDGRNSSLEKRKRQLTTLRAQSRAITRCDRY